MPVSGALIAPVKYPIQECTCTHTHAYTCTYMHTHVRTHVCTCEWVHTYAHTHTVIIEGVQKQVTFTMQSLNMGTYWEGPATTSQPLEHGNAVDKIQGFCIICCWISHHRVYIKDKPAKASVCRRPLERKPSWVCLLLLSVDLSVVRRSFTLPNEKLLWRWRCFLSFPPPSRLIFTQIPRRMCFTQTVCCCPGQQPLNTRGYCHVYFN